MKEFAKGILDSFYIIFTCSIVGLSVYLHILGSESAFLRDIAGIFFISVFTSLIGFVFYSKRELGRLENFTRYAIHFILILAVALSVATIMGWIIWSEPITVIRFVMLVVGIWVAAHLIVYIQSKILVYQLNQKLRERYK